MELKWEPTKALRIRKRIPDIFGFEMLKLQTRQIDTAQVSNQAQFHKVDGFRMVDALHRPKHPWRYNKFSTACQTRQFPRPSNRSVKCLAVERAMR